MVNALEVFARRLRARAGAAATPATAADPSVPARLVGELETVSRLLVVRPGTLAVVLTPDQPPQLKQPGDFLTPPWFGPRSPAVTAFAVSTAPVELEATVTDLVTFDGHSLDRVVLRLVVQVDEGDDYADLRRLVAAHGTGLEAALLSTVRQEVTKAVQGAVRMNRLRDLQRLSLTAVLEARWLPAAFAEGALRCLSCEVQQIQWDASEENEPTVPVRQASS